MARCFPFNCSDYLKELEYAKDEALIESIKPQTEKENAKERRKEKKGKKEKKHKSGKSKEHQEESSHKKRKHSDRSQLGDQDDYVREESSHKKRKHSDMSQLGDQDDYVREESSDKKRKHSDRNQLGDQDDSIQEERSHKKRKHSDRSQLGDQDDCSREPIKDIPQQVDKSSLTQENEPPCFNLNPNDSSDSTQGSNKRKLAAPDTFVVPVRSAPIIRIKPVQKPTAGERPATSAQLQPRFSGRDDVDGEQLQVKSRGLLVQGSRDRRPPASNKLDDILDRNNVLLPPFGPQKHTDGERPAASVQLQPRFSGRAEYGGQLQAKNRTPLIQKSSKPVTPSPNKLGSSVLDRNSVLSQQPATSVHYQPRLAGRAVDGGQLQAKNRMPVTQKSSELVLPSSNKPAGVLHRYNVLPPKPTDGEKAATGVLPKPKLSGRAVAGGQLQVKNRTPVIHSDLVPPSSHKLVGVLDRYNVLPESSELEKATDGKKPATNVPQQPRLSGRAVDEGKNRTPAIQKSSDPVPLSSKKLGMQKSRDPVPPSSNKLAGVLDKDSFLSPPSGLQSPIDGKRSAASLEPQTRFSCREVDGGLPVNNRTPLIQNNIDPAPKFTNGEKPATSRQTEPSFSGRVLDGPVKNRTQVSPEVQGLEPPPSNKLDGVSDMNVDLPLPKVLQSEPPVSDRVMVGVTSRDHARKSKHKSRRSRSGSEDEAQRLFEKLMVNWIPPALQFDLPIDDDQDWLFESKPSNVQCFVPSLPPPQQSDMLAYQARATFLPQVDMYALPYVVPF